MDDVVVIVDLDPPLFGEVLARAIAQPLAGVEVHLGDDPDVRDHLTVIICHESATGEAIRNADLVVRVPDHEPRSSAEPAGAAGAGASGLVDSVQLSDLAELIDHVRELTASSG